MQESAKGPDVSPYADYDVFDKWNTPSFDDATRAVLAARLSKTPTRRFFSQEEFDLLEAIVERLAPPLQGLSPHVLALWIDDRLHDNIGQGFRSEEAPPMQQCWRLGLAGIDGESQRLFSAAFIVLSADDREATLRAVQNGDADPQLWRGLDAVSFFTDTLLTMVTGLAYAHPCAWNDIGFGGPASPRGYVRMGFDSRDPWEARERR